jgi:hypothetical protein
MSEYFGHTELFNDAYLGVQETVDDGNKYSLKSNIQKMFITQSSIKNLCT